MIHLSSNDLQSFLTGTEEFPDDPRRICRKDPVALGHLVNRIDQYHGNAAADLVDFYDRRCRLYQPRHVLHLPPGSGWLLNRGLSYQEPDVDGLPGVECGGKCLHHRRCVLFSVTQFRDNLTATNGRRNMRRPLNILYNFFLINYNSSSSKWSEVVMKSMTSNLVECKFPRSSS